MKLLLGTVLRTVLVYGIAGAILLCTVPFIMLLLLVLPQRGRCSNPLLFFFLHLFYTGVSWALLVPITVRGRSFIPDDPGIIVANHQSTIDVLLLGMILQRRPHLWYALSYYATMPVLGFFIRRLGVPLKRENAQQSAHGLLRGIRLAGEYPCQLIIFPEGTRHVAGPVRDFLRGFALIARKTGRPVIPVFMPFNGLVYPPQSFWVYGHPLLVVVGEPMQLGAEESDEAFVARVHDWFDMQYKLL